VDLLARVGQPVLAAGEGVVTFAGRVAGRGVVTVRHGGGWRTTYEPVTAAVTAGQHVRRGDRLGTVAPSSGHCVPRTCLHWGALLEEDYRDPLALLQRRRPILLPLG
jgi:murein DD-endopeptidase MepM/ murein hydrolase activator NlpD